MAQGWFGARRTQNICVLIFTSKRFVIWLVFCFIFVVQVGFVDFSTIFGFLFDSVCAGGDLLVSSYCCGWCDFLFFCFDFS